MNRFRLLSLGMAGLLAAASTSNVSAAGNWWPFGSGAAAPAEGAAPAAANAAPAPFSFSPIVKKVAPSVVTVFTTKKIREQAPQANPLASDPFFQRFFGGGNGGGLPGQAPQVPAKPHFHEQKGLGSGVIVSPDGVIVTNFHVIDVADEIKVAIGDEKKEYDAKVIGKDQLTDVAVIKIDAKNLPAMTLADSSQVEVGDVVLALGNPFALGQTVTMGIVSALSRNLPVEEAGNTLNSFIQTDAAINPGNSGGPLVDTQGRMVGLNSAIYSRTGGYQGIGFAIPANTVQKVMAGLLKQGRVVRGYLGVAASRNPTPELLQKFGIPVDAPGILVDEVTPQSAAAEAGIRSGDYITDFNGIKVDDYRALVAAVTDVTPGQKVKVTLLRDGKSKTLDVTLKERPANPDQDDPSGAPDNGAAAPSDDLTLVPGVAVDDLDADTRRQMGAAAPPPDMKGAVVVSVDPDSPAAASGSNAGGLSPGDVIVEVEKKEVHGAKEAVAAAKNPKNGLLLLRVWTRGSYRFAVVKTTD